MNSLSRSKVPMLFLFLLHIGAASALCVTPLTELSALLYIQDSIGEHNGGLSLLKPAWQVAPAQATVCGYPGIVCNSNCSITEMKMTEWWVDVANQGSWVLGGSPDVFVPGPLRFNTMPQLTFLQLTICCNSTGMLPGSMRTPNPTFCPGQDLPLGLVTLEILGDENNPPSAVVSSVSVPDNLPPAGGMFNELLSDDGESCFLSLQTLAITNMPGIEDGFGRADMQDSCMNVPTFVLLNVPNAHGVDSCFSPNVFVFDVDTIGDISLVDDQFCFFAPPAVPAFISITHTLMHVLPSCIVEFGVGLAGIGNQTLWSIFSNQICIIPGVPQGDQTNLHLIGRSFLLPHTPSADDGIGFDYNDTVSYVVIEHDSEDDICGVCAGDGESCRDCFRIPFGTALYDVCDVCQGDGTSCLDCGGIPNGSNAYDSCEVCNGENACFDCTNTPHGTLEYDDCDVCGGHNECRDCTGQPFGDVQIDRCGVCGGHNACAPCKEIHKDICGVCHGDGSTCRDCLGDLFGTSRYDRCDVCGGDSSTCIDCAGVPNGPRVYDVCDVCNGNGESCLGCDGMPFGLQYDQCDVCGGDGSCLDCEGTPGGLAQYDECDVCDGDGSSCLDCFGEFGGTGMLNVCGQCYDPETSGMWDCIADELELRINRTVCIWIAVAIGVLLATCLFAWACCYRCGAFLWVFFDEKRTAGRARRNSLGDTERPKDVTFMLPPTADPEIPTTRLRTGGGSGARSIMFATVLTTMISMACATPTLSQAEVLYSELCAHTNIRNQVFGACIPTEPTSVCALVSGLSSYFECYEDMSRLVKSVKLNLVPSLRGRITLAAWDAMRQTNTLRIVMSGGPVYDDDDFNDIDVPEDRLVVEALADDNAFLDFTQLMFLELSGVYVEPGTQLPSTLADSNRLITLELINIANLGGQFGKDNILCSLPVLETLRVRGTQLTGPPRCDRYQSTWLCLKELDVRNNHLTGGLPDLGDLNALELIFADSNRLTLPPLPIELPPHLQVLCLSYNQLAGPLLGAWQILPDLVNFFVDGNQLTGSVPLLDVTGLEGFGISFNQFTGTLPPEYATDQSGMYKEFRVNNNQLEEPWPPFVSEQLCGECAFECNAICREFDSPVPPPPGPEEVCGLCTLINPATGCTNQGICRMNGETHTLACTMGVPATSELLPPSCGPCEQEGFACECTACNCQGDSLDGPLPFVTPCTGLPFVPFPEPPPVQTVYDEFQISRCTYSFEDPNTCAGGCGDLTCIGCDGQANSTLVRDACGVCDGTNSTCTDCNGVLHGTSVSDECGVCNGDGTTCHDCAGRPLGTSQYDLCDVCNGDNTACADCFGVPRGSSQLDACGECEGENRSCTDCNGIVHGTSRFDEFGVCNGRGEHPTPNATMHGNQLAQDIATISYSATMWWLAFELLVVTLACCLCVCASVLVVRYARTRGQKNKNR